MSNSVCSAKMEKMENLESTELRFKQACTQVILLNKQLRDMKTRYNHAKNENLRSFRYNLRLKLAVLEGVRDMYYEYASMKAQTIAELREELFGEIIEIVSGGGGENEDYTDEDDEV